MMALQLLCSICYLLHLGSHIDSIRHSVSHLLVQNIRHKLLLLLYVRNIFRLQSCHPSTLHLLLLLQQTSIVVVIGWSLSCAYVLLMVKTHHVYSNIVLLNHDWRGIHSSWISKMVTTAYSIVWGTSHKSRLLAIRVLSVYAEIDQLLNVILFHFGLGCYWSRCCLLTSEMAADCLVR